MRRLRNPNAADWMCCIGALSFGIYLLGFFEFHRRHGTTPENELTLVEGVPRDVTVSGSRGAKTEIITFAVDRYHTEYRGNRPKYREVHSAIDSGERLTVWISTKRETILPRQDWVPLYKLSVGDRQILTYDEVVAANEEGLSSIAIGASVFIGIGAYVLWLCVQTRRQYAAAANALLRGEVPNERASRPQDPVKTLNWAIILISLVFYSVIIFANLDSKVQAKSVEAFGAEPFGLPVTVVVIFFETLLYLPVPLVVRYRIFQAARDGKQAGLGYLALGCLLLYFVLISGTWIAYCAIRGI